MMLVLKVVSIGALSVVGMIGILACIARSATIRSQGEHERRLEAMDEALIGHWQPNPMHKDYPLPRK